MNPQRYRCLTDKYRSFRGYVFMNGHPTLIRDRATLEAIRKMPEFEEVDNDEAQEAKAAPKVLAAYDCPKCGKEFKVGRYMHIKWCKG